MELIAVEDVRRLLSVEGGIPWHQRSPLLIALGRALDHLPSIPAEPDQELRLRMQRTAREREAVRDLVQAGLLEDRQMQHMREQMAVWAPAGIGGGRRRPGGEVSMDSEMIKALETLEHRAWWRSLRPGQHVIWNRAAHLVLSAPDEDGMVEIENVAPVYMPDGQDRRRVHGSDLAPSVWR